MWSTRPGARKKSRECALPLKGPAERLGAERFVKDLEDAVTFVGQNEAALAGSTHRSQGRAHFIRVPGLSEPGTVTQTCPSFPILMGRGVR